ncbi:predicted protein [Postia placenta Mad-698-R]|nr:predicted protein [Postia placenta Mad-698-R]
MATTLTIFATVASSMPYLPESSPAAATDLAVSLSTNEQLAAQIFTALRRLSWPLSSSGTIAVSSGLVAPAPASTVSISAAAVKRPTRPARRKITARPEGARRSKRLLEKESHSSVQSNETEKADGSKPDSKAEMEQSVLQPSNGSIGAEGAMHCRIRCTESGAWRRKYVLRGHVYDHTAKRLQQYGEKGCLSAQSHDNDGDGENVITHLCMTRDPRFVLTTWGSYQNYTLLFGVEELEVSRQRCRDPQCEMALHPGPAAVMAEAKTISVSSLLEQRCDGAASAFVHGRSDACKGQSRAGPPAPGYSRAQACELVPDHAGLRVSTLAVSAAQS